MSGQAKHPRVYDGGGDQLMLREHDDLEDSILLVPDAAISREPNLTRKIRLMWGQHLLEDLLAGRYRSLVCAVNAQDNSRGIISQLASLLPTSQWDPRSITTYAQQFAAAAPEQAKVLKYDMDMVEVLAILRPSTRDHLTIPDLSLAFKMVGEMIERRPTRLPAASVSFLGAHANRLVGPDGDEPSFETVLRTMYEGGFSGDVFPSPDTWQVGQLSVFARYPFPDSLERLREGGS